MPVEPIVIGTLGTTLPNSETIWSSLPRDGKVSVIFEERVFLLLATLLP